MRKKTRGVDCEHLFWREASEFYSLYACVKAVKTPALPIRLMSLADSDDVAR